MQVRPAIKSSPEKKEEIIIFQYLDDDLHLSEESVNKIIYIWWRKLLNAGVSAPANWSQFWMLFVNFLFSQKIKII